MRGLIALLLWLSSVPALGWVCGSGSPEEEFKSAAAVFMASVTSSEVMATPQGGKYRRVRLRVVESWKSDGKGMDEVVLNASSNCSTVLKLNVTYIIFGFRYSNDELAADEYSSTMPLYWDGECPSDKRECRVVDENAAALLSFLRRKSSK
jgi:hypothetical protein